jgi:hypothetical protein
VLRCAAEYKTNAESLATFIQRKGGINECAARLPGVSGDAAKVTLNTATELLQPGPVFSALTRFIDLQPRI